MNIRMVFRTTAKLVATEALLLLLPLAVSIIYHEKSAFSIIATIVIAVLLSGLVMLVTKTDNKVIYAKEGIATVALAWIAMSLIGALPFVISGEIPSYVDAFFETVSGFTTTGASILTDVERMSRGLLFWRSFTHWVGGMGVLVFVMAVIPNVSDRSIHIMRAEMPGPVIGKLVPRVKDTAKILYFIYIVLTLVQIALLKVSGMDLYESVVHTFATAGTGGFGTKADSIAGYNSACQWIIAVFMFLFGVNFNIYYLMLLKKFSTAVRSQELWVYTAVVALSTAVICFDIRQLYPTFSESLRQSFFQVTTIISTTGFSTADFDLWPGVSKGVLFILMFIGGCAGSTAGGFKVSRLVLLFKIIGRELKKCVHPRSVAAVRFEGKSTDEHMLSSVTAYLAIYVVVFLTLFLILCTEPFDFETNFSAVTACFNNVGPGFGAVGPSLSYADYSVFSKIALSFAMLLGRLEIFPLILAFSPATWSKK